MSLSLNIIPIIKSSALYGLFRKAKYRRARSFVKTQEKLTLYQIKTIIKDELGIKQGDSVLVHCGFGFLNADFTPHQLIKLLQDIVGNNGNIVMPFYPPGLSKNWALSGRVFNPESIKCSTGILAQIFSELDTSISIHPIKSVCAWGKDAKSLVLGHEKSLHPYDELSPYAALSSLSNSKSIGLGVLNCTMIHCAEDLYENNKSYLYSDNIVSLQVINNDKLTTVNTHFHHGEVSLDTSANFFRKHLPHLQNSVKINGVPFYSIENDKLLAQCKTLFSSGVNRQCR